MAKIFYRQMPAPRELSQQIPTPGQKLGCKSPRVGTKFWCESPGCAGRMVMHEVIPALMGSNCIYHHVNPFCHFQSEENHEIVRFYTVYDLHVS